MRTLADLRSSGMTLLEMLETDEPLDIRVQESLRREAAVEIRRLRRMQPMPAGHLINYTDADGKSAYRMPYPEEERTR